jgi:hypothetical protein
LTFPLQVHVEVIRNRYAKDKKETAYPFKGPRDEVKKEVSSFISGLKEDVEELEEGFVDGFMHLVHESPAHERKRLERRASEKHDRNERRAAAEGVAEIDWADDDDEEDRDEARNRQRSASSSSRRASASSSQAGKAPKPPAIFIHSNQPSSRKSATSGLRKKLLRSSSSSRTPDRALTPPGSPPGGEPESLLGVPPTGKSRTFSSSSSTRPSTIRFLDSPAGSNPPSPAASVPRLEPMSPMVNRPSEPSPALTTTSGLLLNPLSDEGEDVSQTFTTASMAADAETNTLGPSISFNLPERPT